MSDESIIRIIGNAPTAGSGITEGFKGRYIGLNMAPLLFLEKKTTCHVCWVQDWRFFMEKKDYFADEFFRMLNWHVVDYMDTVGFVGNITRIKSLGRNGFSTDPGHGIFEGYTAAYGALQLALAYKPEKIELYGVDFSYSLRPARFYQTKIGWDLDLHVHSKQLYTMRKAADFIRNNLDIEVDFVTNSLIDTFVSSPECEANFEQMIK